MLPRKYIVQKSFRIDAGLCDDLEKLSIHLNRSQNELVNFALKKLMQDNKFWFANFILEELAYDYLEASLNCSFKIANVTIDLIINKDFTTTFHYIIKHSENDIEEDTTIYQDTEEDSNKIRESLRSISSSFLDKKSKEVQDYLENRLSYK